MSEVPVLTQGLGTARGSKRTRVLRRVGFGALAVVLILAVLAGGLYWQATRSAVSLDFLRGRVEANLQARLPPDSTVTIGSTAVSYRDDRGVLLRVRDVHLALPGAATVKLGELATVATPSALVRGRVDLDSVSVTGAEIEVTPPRVARQGSRLDNVRDMLEAFMAQAFRADELVRGAGIEEVLLRDARLRLVEAAGRPGPALQIAEASWKPLGPGRSKVWLQAKEKGGAGWDVTVERQVAASGSAALNVEIEDLPIAALAPQLAETAGDKPHFHAGVTLQARMVARPDGSFGGMRGVLSTGGGELSVNGRDRMQVAGSAASFEIAPEGDGVAIPKGELRTRSGNLLFEGALDLGDADRATLIGRVRGGSLPTPASERPVRVTGGGLLAHYRFEGAALEVENFHLTAPEGTISAIGQASFVGPTAGISLALSITQMPAATARAFWPSFVADKSREWFDVNVKSGTLGPATLQVSLPADHIGKRGRDKVIPPNGLVGSLPFENAVFSPLKTFPAVRGASGYVDFGNATATVLAQAGVMGVPGKGDLEVGGTILVINELGRLKHWGDLHLQLAGPAAAIATLSNTPPLSIARKRGIDPDALSGGAQLLLDAKVPLFDAELADLSSSFRLTLADFTSAAPIEGRTIAEADLVLEGTPESFTVKGEGTMDGLKASVDLLLGSEADDQTDVTVSLDDAARERLGLGLGGLLTGTVQASIKRSDPARQQILLDLAQARISIPSLGWEKGPGVPATASFVTEKTEEGTRISELVFAGKGFGAKGELFMDAAGRLRSLNLAEFGLRAGDSLSVIAEAKEKGFDVRVSGGALDARGIIRGLGTSSRESKSDIFPLRVSVKVDKVTGQNEVVLAGVSGSLLVTGKGLENVSLKGSAERGPSFEWVVGKEGGARVVRVRASDGGALIRFTGIYGKVAGGDLVLDYSGTVGGAGTGLFTLRNFRLLNETALEPAVRSARQAATRASSRPEEIVPPSRDLNFSQLRVPFRQEGMVIAIDDAALRGPVLGGTASGTVNVPGKKIAISGTFIPAFGLNNIAGALPIIGTILGGGRDEGLLGITYKLFGPLDSPKLAMNPISAIAPGIFRKIFEYR